MAVGDPDNLENLDRIDKNTLKKRDQILWVSGVILFISLIAVLIFIANRNGNRETLDYQTSVIFERAAGNSENPASALVFIPEDKEIFAAKLTGEAHSHDRDGTSRAMQIEVNGTTFEVIDALDQGETGDFELLLPAGALVNGWNEIKAHIQGNEEDDVGHWVSVGLEITFSPGTPSKLTNTATPVNTPLLFYTASPTPTQVITSREKTPLTNQFLDYGTTNIFVRARGNSYFPAAAQVFIPEDFEIYAAKLTGEGHNQDRDGIARTMRVDVNGAVYEVIARLNPGETKDFEFTLPAGALVNGWNEIKAYVNGGDAEYDNGHWVSVDLELASSPGQTEGTPPAPLRVITPTPAAAQPTQTNEVRQWMDIQMFGRDSGWAVDINGAVFKTTSRTGKWEDVSPPDALLEESGVLHMSWFLDEKHAWLLFQDTNRPWSTGNRIIRTRDGGQTWQSLGELPVLGVETETNMAFIFTDPDHGWLFSKIFPGMNGVIGIVRATIDGGATWETIHNDNYNEGRLGATKSSLGREAFTFVSPEVGYAGGNRDQQLYKTRDGGHTWQPQDFPQPDDFPALEGPYIYPSAPQFTTRLDGVFRYMVFEYRNVWCPPCDMFADLPDAQYLYLTHDGGESWTPRRAPGILGTAGMTDTDSLWFLGWEQGIQETTTLWVSDDDGQTWQVHARGTPLPLGTSLRFFGELHGYAYNSVAGVSLGSMFQLEDLDALDNANLAGRNPFFFITQDGGLTWTPYSPEIEE